mgnify:CR=1 FL=1
MLATSLAETGAQLAEQLGIDWAKFTAQTINFLIVLAVLWKFAYRPVLNMLAERKRLIEEGLAGKGVTVDRKKIHLAHPIKSLGTVAVPVKLHRDVTATVTVEVVKHHEEAPEAEAAEGHEEHKKHEKKAKHDKSEKGEKHEKAEKKEKKKKGKDE